MYYSEQVEKNTHYREEYKKSIDNFLSLQNEKALKRRDGFMDENKYFENTEYYREKFIDMLGFPLREERDERITSKKEFVATDKNVNIYRMQLEIMGISFYGIYFEQKEKNTPFFICLHGGEGTPELVGSIYENSSNYNHMARRLTDEGYSVFCPQLLLWNKDFYGNEYDRVDIHNKLVMLGGSVTALEIFLMSQSLDYFINEEKINADRIGVAGLSYGGQFATDLAAFDKRIKVCCAQGQFNSRFKYTEFDWCYFDALNTISDAEKAALICPRALSICVGDNDWLFDHKSAEEENLRLKKYFEKFDAEDNYDFYIFEGSHETDKSDRWIDFIRRKI